MLSKTRCLFLILTTVGVMIGQPPPPPPPGFMSMASFRLSCFDKPNFVQDGLEFFVCNGGGGIAGVRKNIDPARTVFVRDPDAAQNLNMQAAKVQCAGKQFTVRADNDGGFSFLCQGKELEHNERFKPASKSDWKRYAAYLNK